jgi:hypothetical protein
MGQPVKVMQGDIPKNKHDVLAIMAGTAKFDLASARNTILPGGVCEHLTSLGGVLTNGAGQSPLTDFLRAGAAGASGTVIEPFAIQAKFPLPSLPLHYRRGCSLAEAFYQSVSGPYQLLIVGDPLCQPWATPPQVTLEGLEAGDEVRGTIVLKPSAKPAPKHSISFHEVYVDGILHSRLRPGRDPSLDTTKLADGYHELRVVAVDANAIESQGRMILPIRVNNHGVSLDFTVTPQDKITAQTTLKLRARQPGAEGLTFMHHHRELGRASGEDGQLEVAAVQFGRGPVPLHARSEGEHPAVSDTIWVQIE